jgi:sugar lactone lactonase YvrE
MWSTPPAAVNACRQASWPAWPDGLERPGQRGQPLCLSVAELAIGRAANRHGDKVRRQEPDGSMVVHAGQAANEIVVDLRGNAYVNGADFDFAAGAPPKPGYIKLVTPDGQLRPVADDIQFPNGMVIGRP